MLSKEKKTTLIVIAGILAVILIIAGILYCPRKLSNKLPNEKIISVNIEYKNQTENGTVKLAQDKISEFEEKLNSLWYVKNIGIYKGILSSPETYIIEYENYTVTVWQYYAMVIHNTDQTKSFHLSMCAVFPNNIYQELRELFSS